MSFSVWAPLVQEAEGSGVKLRRRKWRDPVRMWRGVAERKVDGRGTGLCPPECPVRPHDHVVQPYAHGPTEAHFNVRKTIKGMRGYGNHRLCFSIKIKLKEKSQFGRFSHKIYPSIIHHPYPLLPFTGACVQQSLCKGWLHPGQVLSPSHGSIYIFN